MVSCKSEKRETLAKLDVLTNSVQGCLVDWRLNPVHDHSDQPLAIAGHPHKRYTLNPEVAKQMRRGGLPDQRSLSDPDHVMVGSRPPSEDLTASSSDGAPAALLDDTDIDII